MAASHTEVIRDQVQSLRVVRDLCVQSGEIEPVQDVILFYFAKVFVAFRRKEPGDPLRYRRWDETKVSSHGERKSPGLEHKPTELITENGR